MGRKLVDADELKSSLTLEQIEYLLRALGAEEVVITDEIVMSNTICHNESGGKLKLWYHDTFKSFRCFTGCGGHNYTIYNLVIQVFDIRGVTLTFSEALEWVLETLGMKVDEKPQGFGFEVVGKTTLKHTKREEMEVFEILDRANEKLSKEKAELVFYSDMHKEQFSHHGGHTAFTNDFISEEAMDNFEIMSDRYQNSIIIPHRHYKNGQIIGFISRNLNQHQVDKGFKYIPYRNSKVDYRFPKQTNLYGAWQNKKAIQTLRKVAVFEAEKSVLQCETFFGQNNYSVALGGSSMDDYQINILLDLGVREVYLCLDRDYKEMGTNEANNTLDHMIRIAKRLLAYFTVYIVYDGENLLEEKDSPSDKGKEVLIELFKKKEVITLEFIETWDKYIQSL